MKIDYIKILLIGLVLIFIVVIYNLTREKSKFGTCYDICTKKLKEKNEDFKNFCSAGLYPIEIPFKNTDNPRPDVLIPLNTRIECKEIDLACFDICD